MNHNKIIERVTNLLILKIQYESQIDSIIKIAEYEIWDQNIDLSKRVLRCIAITDKTRDNLESLYESLTSSR